MKDIIEGAAYLNIPIIVVSVIVGLFFVMQIIGAIIDFKTKAAPEVLAIWKYFKRKKDEKKEDKEFRIECKKVLDDVNAHYNEDNITKRNNWMNEVNSSIKNNDALIQALDGKIDKLLETNAQLTTQLEQVKSNVLNNEADRLRAEIFDCGNRCRRHIRLHPEEMEHIRAVYVKYSDELHQNGTGQAEFKFITEYYNNQDFPTYHQPNNKN